MFRILSVDNNITRSNLTAKAVKNLKFGARLNYALSATQAVLYIAGVKASKKVLPDMIIQSAQLPDAIGINALQTIVEAVENDGIPIIIVSDDKVPQSGIEYYKAGACAYVSRGNEVEAFMEAIGDTVTFVAMVEGYIPKQPKFFPEEEQNFPNYGDLMQVHL